MRTKLNQLFIMRAPWILVGPDEPDRAKWLPAEFYADGSTKVYVRTIRGTKTATRADFMNEIGAALQFFNEFGENWLALLDCLRNLEYDEGSDAYIMVFSDAESILWEASSEALEALLKTMDDVGKWMAEHDKPFHAVFYMSEVSERAMERYRVAALNANVEVQNF